MLHGTRRCAHACRLGPRIGRKSGRRTAIVVPDRRRMGPCVRRVAARTWASLLAVKAVRSRYREFRVAHARVVDSYFARSAHAHAARARIHTRDTCDRQRCSCTVEHVNGAPFITGRFFPDSSLRDAREVSRFYLFFSFKRSVVQCV